MKANHKLTYVALLQVVLNYVSLADCSLSDLLYFKHQKLELTTATEVCEEIQLSPDQSEFSLNEDDLLNRSVDSGEGI